MPFLFRHPTIVRKRDVVTFINNFDVTGWGPWDSVFSRAPPSSRGRGHWRWSPPLGHLSQILAIRSGAETVSQIKARARRNEER